MNQKKRIYVARFTLKRKTDEIFFKIGISEFVLARRFAADLCNYDIALLAESTYLPTMANVPDW